MINKIAVIQRIKDALKISSDAELANILGIKRSTLSNWKARNTIDFDVVFSKCESINADWLLTGRGPMLRDDAPSDEVRRQHIEQDSNVGKCSSVKDPIDNIFEAASGPNIEVVRELMAKITEQAIEIGRLRERISLINNGIKNTGGGILPTPSKSNPPKFNPPTPSKSNPPKSNPPAMPAISQPDMLIRKPRTESTSVLVTEKSARSIRKSR